MRKSHFIPAIPLLTGLLVSVAQAALPAVVEFSADVQQSGPQGAHSVGRVYVANDGMRTEMTQGGQQVIQIFDSKTQTTRMIFPAQKSYIEQQGAAGAPAAPAQEGSEVDPCRGGPGAKCHKLGSDTIGGREAVKWEMTLERQGKVLSSTQWIDVERGFPLRQEMPNNQRMEQNFLGKEDLHGREVEKGEMKMMQVGQAPQSSYRWFDPQLNMAIREEFPGGYVREMLNIRVGAQDPALFQVPAGFEKVTPQQLGRPAGKR